MRLSLLSDFTLIQRKTSVNILWPVKKGWFPTIDTTLPLCSILPVMGSINPSLDANHSTSTRNSAIYGGGLMDGRGAMPVPVLGGRVQDGLVGNVNVDGNGVGSGGEGAYATGVGVTADTGNGETRRRPDYFHSTQMFSPHSRAWEMNDSNPNSDPNPNSNSNTVPRLATNSHSNRHWGRDGHQHPQQQQQQRDHQDGRPRDHYERSEMYENRDRHQDYPMDSPRCSSLQTPLSHGGQPIYGPSLTPSYQQTSSHPHQSGHPSSLTAMPASYNPVSILDRVSSRPYS